MRPANRQHCTSAGEVIHMTTACVENPFGSDRSFWLPAHFQCPSPLLSVMEDYAVRKQCSEHLRDVRRESWTRSNHGRLRMLLFRAGGAPQAAGVFSV